MEFKFLPTALIWLLACFQITFGTEWVFTTSFAESAARDDPRPVEFESASSQDGKPTSTPLNKSQKFTPSIRGGETQVFTFELGSGDFAEVSIRWQGMDLDVLVRKPDGTLFFPTPIPIRGMGPIPILLIADQPGTYKLEVQSIEQVQIVASFDILLNDVRSATPTDKDRVTALGLMTQGQAQKSHTLALENYLQALKLWQSALDQAGVAYARHGLGRAYLSTKGKDNEENRQNEENAREQYSALIQLRQSLNDSRSLIYTLREIGQDYRALNKPTKAIEYYNSALQIATNDRQATASLFYSLGFAYASIPDTTAALEFYEKARAIQHQDGDRLNEARTLNAMGGVHNLLGDQASALTFYEQAIPVFLELADFYRAAIMKNNVGLAYDDLGDWDKARNYYVEAISDYKSLLKNDPTACRAGASPQTLRICASLANTEDNVGELHNSTGDPEGALRIFATTLPVREVVNQPRGLGLTLSRICYSNVLLGRTLEAIPNCEKALEFSRRAEDNVTSASALTFLGMAYAKLTRNDKAFDYYDQALQLQRAKGTPRGQGITLNQIGSLYVATRQPEKALLAFNEALTVWRTTKDEDGETITRYHIAKLERDRGNFSGAHEQIEKALQIVENRRATLNSQRLLASYFANKQDYYELAIDVDMTLAKAQKSDVFVERALEASERARGRRLLDSLAEAAVIRENDQHSIAASHPRLKKLVEHQSQLRLSLSAKANARTLMLGRKHTREEEIALNKEIEKLTAEYDEVEGTIRALNPAYASLTKPETLSVNEIRAQLDAGTLSLEYFLGEDRSYVWAISPESVKGFELPPKKKIEAAASRLLETLTVAIPPNDTRTQARAREARYIEDATILSDMVLAPVANLLRKKRLAIVADGLLQQVPFNALLVPSQAVLSDTPVGKQRIRNKRFLMEDYEIVSLPSVSVLAVQRRLLEKRKQASLLVAVVADPVLNFEDGRGGESGRRLEPREPSPLTRALKDVGIGSLPPLYFARREAKSILQVVPKDQSTAKLGFDANRSAVMSPELSNYQIVHFATHGILDLENPELSGLVLSMFDEQGRPQNGFLQLHEIYKLNLPAELVVLSACQTGVGKQVKGEGLIALTRGFMYAGAARLVASYWDVDDAATAELMAEFYKQIFTNGKTPAEALQAAQLHLRRQPRWNAPIYWAGFFIQGEWR